MKFQILSAAHVFYTTPGSQAGEGLWATRHQPGGRRAVPGRAAGAADRRPGDPAPAGPQAVRHLRRRQGPGKPGDAKGAHAQGAQNIVGKVKDALTPNEEPSSASPTERRRIPSRAVAAARCVERSGEPPQWRGVLPAGPPPQPAHRTGGAEHGEQWDRQAAPAAADRDIGPSAGTGAVVGHWTPQTEPTISSVTVVGGATTKQGHRGDYPRSAAPNIGVEDVAVSGRLDGSFGR